MTYSRRRMPYSIGADKLEFSLAKVKKHLDPADEEKLSGDMRELYDRILPSADSDDRRARFVKKLETILNDRWPGNNVKVNVFGSSGNLLCTNESDGRLALSSLDIITHWDSGYLHHDAYEGPRASLSAGQSVS